MACIGLSLDTETTGLRAYHGDRLFSIIIGDDYNQWYFNFQAYPGMPVEQILLDRHLELMTDLFQNREALWYLHNAPFDIAMLAQENLKIQGTIHCTKAGARVLYNDHLGYSLDDCAGRIGFHKDDAVKKYVMDHELWEWETIPGKKARKKRLFYHKVPPDIIIPYGETDAKITRILGKHQEEAIKKIDEEPLYGKDDQPRSVPPLSHILANERRLTRTVCNMEAVGLKIDGPYCVRASRYELERAEKAGQEFKRLSGSDFKSSGKLFAVVFASDQENWKLTELGNPSFDSDVLKKFKNPAAQCVLDYRDAKSKSDFYHSFLYHADSQGYLHPHLDPSGTGTGRFSSSDPNFQNLTSEEGDEDQEFIVRRAIIPPEGFFYIMPDYDQMEYRMMFEYVCRFKKRVTEIVTKILEGHDPHQATADEVTNRGFPLSRKHAKNGNFAILYGAGDQVLADTIGSTKDAARELKRLIFLANPELKEWIGAVINAAEYSHWVANWAGRRYSFPIRDYSYRAPNYLIQGGCADVVKFAMNEIDTFLYGYKSKLVLQIHDELPILVHESEAHFIPQKVKSIMEGIFPAKYLPLTCGMEYSKKSLGDKIKGFPV